MAAASSFQHAADEVAAHEVAAGSASADDAVTASPGDLRCRAEAVGVTDALVLRRINTTTWAQLGGIGRGNAWAGLVELDESDDSLAVRIPTRVGEVHRDDFTEPSRVLGPYYATASAVVRVSPDIAVVLGGNGDLMPTVEDAELLRLAWVVESEVDEVQPSKRLADELEILTAVRKLMDVPTDSGLPDTLRHMLAVNVSALTCEVGALRGTDGSIITVGADSVPTDEWELIFDEAEARLDGEFFCAQDMSSSPSERLVTAMPEARSVLAVPVPPPTGGTLLFVHTAANPRGFSLQCQRICHNILEAGLVVVQTAVMRDELRAAANEAKAMARTDPLTKLGNRLAWDEAIAAAQERVDAGAAYSVVSIDIDGLKGVNDRHGHVAGDQLLRRCAEMIRAHCSEVDIAVRMGGDEFAVLVPHALGDTDDTVTAFRDAVSELYSTRERVAASIGVCTVTVGESVFDAVRDADLRMYRSKQQRRRRRRAAEGHDAGEVPYRL